MDGYIKVLGVSIGFHESEVIKALSNKNVKVGKNNACIFTDGGVYFLGETMQINYRLKDSKVSEISIHWCFANKGKANSKEDESKVYNVGKNAIDYISNNGIWKYKENVTYGNGVRNTYTFFMDLYNEVYVMTQYKIDPSSINAVGIYIRDTYKECISKDDFEFLRSQQIIENIKNKTQINNKACNRTKERIKESSIWFKVAVIITLLVLGLLYMQNNRFYYTNKGKVKVDKWTSEYFYLNSSGEYVKK